MVQEILTVLGGKMQKIRIGNRLVGEGEPCFAIAEAGSNHDGKLEQARYLIDAAKEAGVDAVKFQTFRAEKFASPKYAKEMYKILEKYELKTEWHAELKNYADELGIIFLSTPFDEESVDLLDEIGVSAFKVASGDLTHLPLLQYIAKKGKPMIVSTGAGNLGEVEAAINTTRNQGNNEIILLHCVSNYPAKVENANIRAIVTMRETFHLPVGYSDHSLGSLVTLAAVALGACIIEKHVTLDRSSPGPDHPFAMTVNEFQKMVRSIRALEKGLGNGIKHREESEKAEVKIARRSLFADVNIPKGAAITKQMIKIVRPGIGIYPKYLSLIIGKEAKIDIREDEVITWDII